MLVYFPLYFFNYYLYINKYKLAKCDIMRNLEIFKLDIIIENVLVDSEDDELDTFKNILYKCYDVDVSKEIIISKMILYYSQFDVNPERVKSKKDLIRRIIYSFLKSTERLIIKDGITLDNFFSDTFLLDD